MRTRYNVLDNGVIVDMFTVDYFKAGTSTTEQLRECDAMAMERAFSNIRVSHKVVRNVYRVNDYGAPLNHVCSLTIYGIK